MENLKLVLGVAILVLNLISFIMVGYDKRKARLNGWRIPEKRLFILAFSGGAIGIYLGMKKFRHKTKHNSFIYGIPFIILLNFGLFYIIFI